MMVGRSAERSRLVRLVADAKAGRSRSLVVRGEAGIGKTALLEYAAGVAGGMRILRVVGIESEAEIPFAALQLMLARDVERFDALPAPHAQALRAAFGTGSASGDRLMVGAATLTLLSELAGEGPLLCLFDDVQWFDRSSADALLFAVRRLHTDPVGAVFAVRDGERPFPAAGIDDIRLPRLGARDSAELLATVGPLPQPVADRVLEESGGNPLAIMELARSGTAALPSPVAPLAAVGRLEEHYQLQVRALPSRTRLALLLVAADHGCELWSFLAAAERLGLGADDLEPAEQMGLVRVTGEAVEFRHPLIRAAAYQEAPFARRLAAHRALADVLSDPRDADRRAWHAATAAGGTDDGVADELERAAERALARGAPAAASRALERAVQLSGDPAVQARRLVTAARAAYDAGLLDHAATLAAAVTAMTGPALAGADPAEGGAMSGNVAWVQAEAAWIRAQVAYERDSPARACELAIDAATPVLTADPARAISVLIEAVWCARDSADEGLLARCGEQLGRVRGGPPEVARALGGFVGLLSGRTEEAVPPMRDLLLAAGDGGMDATLEGLSAGFLGVLIGADDLALKVLDRQVATMRAQGALGWLPYAQEPLALAQLVTGRFRDAEANVAEALSLAAELGQDLQAIVLTAISCCLAAVRGEVDTARQQADLVLKHAGRHGMAAAQATWALALIDLMAGDPHAALDRLDEVCAGPPGRDVTVRAIADHVEAGVRAGDLDRARRHLPQLASWAGHTASPAAEALLLRCTALLDDSREAQGHFEASLAVDGCGLHDRARTRLAYGEWLRRHRRPTSARAQLSQALATFDQVGAYGWHARVRTELVALGGPVPPADTAAAEQLTAQELQVVRRAALGLSNREIAAQLFLSPRTVGHHLYKAYPKLGVSRRAELAQLDL
ncbi:ATP-binding protein [Nonomuraea endophytica]|uniref:DNA-binding CsgD family transcriptional regulator n=1 Tax=Nonomuraea endophytica TaxID=714136 RepID=A0A7W8A3M9_9ACTN|nr:LuxR family transcriptional regulator [Nonomuraea endophytica]MBB5078379.1 DNA-binding CsgD family transcriptional regulator [Nonomuraea endophytica]